MLNLRFIVNIITIFFLVLLQVFVFSNLKLGGVVSPCIYIIFIILYPPTNNRFLLLLFCFLLGVGVDTFESTGGINAIACLTIGFLSKHIIKVISGTRFFEIEEFKFSDFNAVQWFIYVVVMVFIHQFIVFVLESFSLSNLDNLIMKILYSTAFSTAFIIFYLVLFRKKVER